MRAWRNIAGTMCACGTLALIGLLFCGCGPQDVDFLSPDEREWLDSHGHDIVLSHDPTWHPDQEFSDQHVYGDLAEELLALVEGKLGITFKRFNPKTWEDVAAAEQRGDIDAHLALLRTEDRLSDWIFTDAYIKVPVVLIVNEAGKASFKADRIPSMSMAVGQHFGIPEFARTHCNGFNLVTVESDLFGLMKVSLGEIDTMLIDLATASYHVEREGITNLRLAARLGSLYDFSFASRRDLPLLHSILEKTLRQITPAERKQIYERSIRFGPPPFYQSRTFWYWMLGCVAAVLAIVTNILFWNKALKREVVRTTRELRAELQERHKAERALSKVHAELEDRVETRTHELAEANEALRTEMSKRERMSREILHISSGERARIGRDLHDSIGQQLVGVTFLAQAIEENARTEDTVRLTQTAAKIRNLVQDTITRTKFVVKGLLPVDIVDEGLVFALKKLAQDTSDITGIPCTFSGPPDFRSPGNTEATNLYRIVQEAVSNAYKHGNATRIDITLTVTDNEAIFTVTDNGQGIARDTESRGMGINIMHYRSELAGGCVSIDSESDKGTTVRCRIPYETSPQKQETT